MLVSFIRSMKNFLCAFLLTFSLWPVYALLLGVLCRRYGNAAVLACVVVEPAVFFRIRLVATGLAQCLFLYLLCTNEPWHWLFFCYLMLLLSLVDVQLRLLPDYVLACLLILGLLAHIMSLPDTPGLAMLIPGLGATIIIALLLTALGRLHAEDEPWLAAGDIKLIVVLSVWFSYEQLPMVLLLASFSGLVYILVKECATGVKPRTLAFGPCLALGSIVVHLAWRVPPMV